MKRFYEKWTKRKLHLSLDNKGLSLVELLVAMIILTIVVVPMCRAFVSSANVNAKARKTHQGTSIAQNIFEGLKTDTLSHIAYQFKSPLLPDNSRNFDILPSEMLPITTANPTVAGQVATTDCVDVGAGGTTYTFKKSATNTYDFYMLDVQMGNTKYDALISFDGSPYSSADPVLGTPATSGQAFNDSMLVQIPEIDTANDAVANYDCKVGTDAGYNDIAKAAIEVELQGTAIQMNRLSRAIQIQVTNSVMTWGGYQNIVTVTYSYTYNTSGLSKTVTPKEYSEIIFNNSSAESERIFRSLYLFYQPLYGAASDTITLDNTHNRDMNFYIIKQYDKSNGNLIYDENNYRATLNIRENDALKTHTKIITNLNKNIKDDNPVPAGRITYQKNGGNIGDMSINSLENKASTDLLYDVKIQVFEKSEDATGTPDTVNWFDDHVKVAEMTGTIGN